MSELRSVQQSCGQLRTQMASIKSNMDTSHIVAVQEALSRNMSMIEDGAWTNRRALRREQQRVAETQRISNKSGSVLSSN